MTSKELEQIWQDIWRGKITLEDLPKNLYFETKDKLQTAVEKGFKKKLKHLPFENPDFKTLTKLLDNTNIFSAAKTFQNIKEAQSFIFDKKGFVRPFTKFRENVKPIFEKFKENWLQVEYDTAIAQAQSASQWDEIEEQKEIFPLLKYQTVGDQRVRPEHRSWDGIVRPVNDKFWDTHMPPNDFNCRCIVIQLEADEEKTTDLKKHLEKVKKETKDEISSLRNTVPLFSMNPGKDKLIFKEQGKGQHPYFKVGEKYEVLKRKHFNLPK